MKVTFYIRKADEAKWEEIKDKPDFIHASINGFEPQHRIDKALVSAKNSPIDYPGTVSYAQVVSGGPTTRRLKACEHGAAIGFCKFGCKK